MHVRLYLYGYDDFFFEKPLMGMMMILRKIVAGTHEKTDGPSGRGRESLLGRGSRGPDENPK